MVTISKRTFGILLEKKMRLQFTMKITPEDALELTELVGCQGHGDSQQLDHLVHIFKSIFWRLFS